jgi:hypothetical protein
MWKKSEKNMTERRGGNRTTTKHAKQNSARQNIATKTARNKTEIKLNCRWVWAVSWPPGAVPLFSFIGLRWCFCFLLQQRAISSRAVVVALFCRALFWLRSFVVNSKEMKKRKG